MLRRRSLGVVLAVLVTAFLPLVAFAQTNQLNNPSFETEALGLADWGSIGVTRSTSYAYDGNYGAYLASGTSWLDRSGGMAAGLQEISLYVYRIPGQGTPLVTYKLNGSLVKACTDLAAGAWVKCSFSGEMVGGETYRIEVFGPGVVDYGVVGVASPSPTAAPLPTSAPVASSGVYTELYFGITLVSAVEVVGFFLASLASILVVIRFGPLLASRFIRYVSRFAR